MAKMTTCASCGAEIPKRRDNKSGQSFCTSKPECRAARTRFYRARRDQEFKAAGRGETDALERDLESYRQAYGDTTSLLLGLLGADPAFARREEPCPECGREGAINFFPHFEPDGKTPCFALGRDHAKGRKVDMRVMQALFPRAGS